MDLQTMPDGSFFGSRRFDAFGGNLQTTGSWFGPNGYGGSVGYQEVPQSGLKLLGHRYYDSSTGRFLTRDPIKDGGNWYSYCGNNPVTGMDPEGLQQDPSPLSHLSDPDVWMEGLQISLDALLHQLSFGFYDGGRSKGKEGFNESATSWFIADLCLLKLGIAKAALKGLYAALKLGNKFTKSIWRKCGFLLGTANDVAKARSRLEAFMQIGIMADTVRNRIKILDWLMEARKLAGVIQKNGRIRRDLIVTGPNGKKGKLVTFWEPDGRFVTGWLEVFR